MINEDSAIQESLLQLSNQLGHPLAESSIEQIYQNVWDLLSHISPTPITLARVASTLLGFFVLSPEKGESAYL